MHMKEGGEKELRDYYWYIYTIRYIYTLLIRYYV